MAGFVSRFLDARFLLSVALALPAAVLLVHDAGAQHEGRSGEYEGLTRPSKDVDLVLRVTGVLAEMPVSPGQRVRSGELVAALKTELEKASVEIARLKAESDHEIRIADLDKKFLEAELERLRGLQETQAVSDREITKALVDFELSEVRSEAARFGKELAIQEYKREQLALAERRLLAPFEGVILRTLKEVGEGVDELEPIAILVKLDPIWVECNLPAELFGKILVGQPADAEVADRKRTGKIVAVDPLVDAASDTFRIVLEVPNGDGAIVGGITATVRFSSFIEAAKQP